MERSDQAGTGLVTSTAAVGVVLSFLLLAAHTLVRLHATSVLSAAGAHAVRTAAADGPAPGQPSAIRAAETEARSALGKLGRTARFVWSTTDDGRIRLELTVRSPSILPLGSPTLRRAFLARIEEGP